jgi:hypothetical protein
MGFPPLWNVAAELACPWDNATPGKKVSTASRADIRKTFPLQSKQYVE